MIVFIIIIMIIINSIICLGFAKSFPKHYFTWWLTKSHYIHKLLLKPQTLTKLAVTNLILLKFEDHEVGPLKLNVLEALSLGSLSDE